MSLVVEVPEQCLRFGQNSISFEERVQATEDFAQRMVFSVSAIQKK